MLFNSEPCWPSQASGFKHNGGVEPCIRILAGIVFRGYLLDRMLLTKFIVLV